MVNNRTNCNNKQNKENTHTMLVYTYFIYLDYTNRIRHKYKKKHKKNIDVKFSVNNPFLEITFIRYAHIRKIGNPNNKVLGSNKAKGPKQYSQNQLMSPMPREENLSFIENYIAYEVFLNGI